MKFNTHHERKHASTARLALPWPQSLKQWKRAFKSKKPLEYKGFSRVLTTRYTPRIRGVSNMPTPRIRGVYRKFKILYPSNSRGISKVQNLIPLEFEGYNEVQNLIPLEFEGYNEVRNMRTPRIQGV